MFTVEPLWVAPGLWCSRLEAGTTHSVGDGFAGCARKPGVKIPVPAQLRQRKRDRLCRARRTGVFLIQEGDGDSFRVQPRRQPTGRNAGFGSGTLVLTRPVYLSRRPERHRTFERPLARWMYASLLKEASFSGRYMIPSLPMALRHIANALQEPLQYGDFVSLERARQYVGALLRGHLQRLPAFEFLAPTNEEVQQPLRGLRGRSTSTRSASRTPNAVGPRYRFLELRIRTPAKFFQPHSTDSGGLRAEGGVHDRRLDQRRAYAARSNERTGAEPPGLTVIPGLIDWTEDGALEKWYTQASRWRLLDGGSLCNTQRPVIELSHDESIPFAARAGSQMVGFRVLDRRWTRFLCNHPRVIAIGDIHGCIAELQDLLRVCDYRPGDEVVLLGDLVAKGPDSQAVVQMAREIGARAVRGNHDHEVIRCREAMLRGHDPSYASVDHMRIARQLGQLEHDWMRSWPWYIRSDDLQTVFVHAGFLPCVPLEEQLPRYMMNLRSVLEDGTPSARHVSGMSWARLWKGPWRVVYGHDAFMGLQVWEKCIGIDTGCVYGGRLTALLLPENRLVSVPARKMYVHPRKRS
ncbi:hypothetical protein CCYA_CCYA04G1152 [Cyanidiococcus yangmingshanensis]|nr:hypothetical protein CCYA_CCYA04G1152 [Cyanidiococcus yangmingshanensis]